MVQRKHIALVSLKQFDPFLRDGGSWCTLALLQFLKEQGNKVTIFNFLTNEPGLKLLFDDALADSASDILRKNNICRATFQGLNYYQEVLPCRLEQLVGEYRTVVRTIRERMQQQHLDYIVTTDQDYFSLVATWLLKIPGMHLFHALNNVQQFARNTDYIRFLRGRPIFVLSQFLQTQVKALLGLNSVIWPPFIKLNLHPSQSGESRSESIGFCASSGWAEKGGDIVIEISHHMPERSFIAVGRGGTSQYAVRPANLAYWGHIADMDQFFRQINLLLVPSVVEEAFGRVILEAAAYGIPAIANRVGGIPEVLGDSGILIDWDQDKGPNIAEIAEKYVREIRRVLNDDDLYRRYSRKALTRAKAYEVEQTRQAHEVYDRYIR